MENMENAYWSKPNTQFFIIWLKKIINFFLLFYMKFFTLKSQNCQQQHSISPLKFNQSLFPISFLKFNKIFEIRIILILWDEKKNNLIKSNNFKIWFNHRFTNKQAKIKKEEESSASFNNRIKKSHSKSFFLAASNQWFNGRERKKKFPIWV